MRSAIAQVSAALPYDVCETLLADAVSLTEVYSTAVKLRTVSEDIAAYTTDDSEQAEKDCPPTLRVPSSNTNIGGCAMTVIEEVKS